MTPMQITKRSSGGSPTTASSNTKVDSTTPSVTKASIASGIYPSTRTGVSLGFKFFKNDEKNVENKSAQ